MAETKDKKIIVLIPARGGSKRFPGKNIYPLLGKPLIAHTIEKSKEAKWIDRVIVSTDDEKIAAVAKQYGAEVPFMRPAELATDTSPVIDTMVYTVEKLNNDFGYRADYTVLLQAVSPLFEVHSIDQAIDLALVKAADSVVAVTEVNTLNHPYNVRSLLPDGRIKFWQEELHYKDLGQSKPKFYHAGVLWLSSYDTLVKHHRLEGENNYPVMVKPVHILDIDYKEDLEFIEAYINYQANKKAYI